jgi:hypothetical protein
MLRRSLRRVFDPYHGYRGDDRCGTCIQISGEYGHTKYDTFWWHRTSARCNFCTLILLAVDSHIVAAKARDSNASCSILKSESGHLTFEIKWTDAGRQLSSRHEIFTDEGGQRSRTCSCGNTANGDGKIPPVHGL